MTVFKLSDRAEVVCIASDTRNGFKHVATLVINGRDVESEKANYLNRTWESFPYQSVMRSLADKTTLLNDEEKAKLTEIVKG